MGMKDDCRSERRTSGRGVNNRRAMLGDLFLGDVGTLGMLAQILGSTSIVITFPYNPRIEGHAVHLLGEAYDSRHSGNH